MAYPESVTMKLGIVLLGIGIVLHIVAFSVPHWYSGPGVHGGLWVVCVDDIGCDSTPDNVGSVFHSIQALEAIALIFALLGAASVLWLLQSPSLQKLRVCKSLTTAAGMLALCGVIIFLIKYTDDKEWGAYMEIPAGVMILVGGIMFWVEGRRTGTYESVP